jgi:ferredoxin
MSYEGYEQLICKNGHYFENYDTYNYEASCPICQEKAAWNNQVDQTNGGNQGIIFQADLKRFIKEEAKKETCPTCSHCKEIAPAVYRIPTKEETYPLQRYDDLDLDERINKELEGLSLTEDIGE